MPRIDRLPADKQVVAPDQKAEHGDGEARKADEGVAENPLAAKTGDDLAHHAHAGQNHDVHGRMRIKPEQMLKQDRIAAQLGIENADASAAAPSPPATAKSPARACPAPR